jgi:hypothetical protein
MMAAFWSVMNWWADAVFDLRRCPLTECTDEQAEDLEAMIGKTIAEWKQKHGIEVT